MPFTISHPALVLPLKQLRPRWFSLSGLMAGAVAPDLIYFLTLTTAHRGISHSWSGLFIFCLPAGIAFAFAFHRLFKYHFISNLPRPMDRFLSGLAEKRFHIADWRGLFILACSVLIGALSHFFWDSMTHEQGEIARLIPFLLKKSVILGRTVPNYRIVQHLSTVFGILIILIYTLKSNLIPPASSNRSIRKPRQKLIFWIAGGLVALALACLAIRVYYGYNIFHIDRGFSSYPISTTFGLAGWAVFFYYVCIYTLVKKYIITKQ
jgi:hypothetical protein